jgi:hypothetical protein
MCFHGRIFLFCLKCCMFSMTCDLLIAVTELFFSFMRSELVCLLLLPSLLLFPDLELPPPLRHHPLHAECPISLRCHPQQAQGSGLDLVACCCAVTGNFLYNRALIVSSFLFIRWNSRRVVAADFSKGDGRLLRTQVMSNVDCDVQHTLPLANHDSI